MMKKEKSKIGTRKKELKLLDHGSWCYGCNDIFKNNTILKMHMETDYKSKSF